MPNVGIYPPLHVFSHGQLYVALSIGVSQTSTKFFIKEGHLGKMMEILPKMLFIKKFCYLKIMYYPFYLCVTYELMYILIFYLTIHHFTKD